MGSFHPPLSLKPALPVQGRFSFYIQALDEAETLSKMLATFFPHSERALQGIWELLINAIEHGLYGITPKQKCVLVKAGRWLDEMDRRADDAHFERRYVKVTLQACDEHVLICVQDSGRGFNWRRWVNRPLNHTLPHGRGIAIAHRLSFDEMRFNLSGNRVTALMYK